MTALRQKQGSLRRAFTLIEMLVVIAILGILVALVVNVGKYIQEKSARDKTRVTMEVIKAAWDAYYEIDNNYPPDTEPKKNKNGDDIWNVSEPPATETFESGTGITILYMYLTGRHFANNEYNENEITDLSAEPCVKAATEKLRYLSTDAMSEIDHAFHDGFGNRMRYRCNGSMGGKPLLTSAGGDGMFTIDVSKRRKTRDASQPSPYDWYDVPADTDNIRSDGR